MESNKQTRDEEFWRDNPEASFGLKLVGTGFLAVLLFVIVWLLTGCSTKQHVFVSYEPKPEIDKRVAAITPQDFSQTHTIVDRAALPAGWTFRVATVWGSEDILSWESVFTLKLPIWIGYDYVAEPGGVQLSMIDGFRAYVTRHGRTNTLFVGNVLAFQYPPQTTASPPSTVRITWPPPGPARIYRGLIPFPAQMAFMTNAPGTNLIVTKGDHEYFFSPDKRLTIR